MKLFWVILRGFLIIWVMLAVAIIGMLFLVMDMASAIQLGGIATTLITGVVVYLVVQNRVKKAEKTHPELRKR
ncbi:MAG: hypothetical protein JXQ29_14345 [Planctomycetes bacterium]|nr:hypothetical protein [Planctomycetota bacterium]